MSGSVEVVLSLVGHDEVDTLTDPTPKGVDGAFYGLSWVGLDLREALWR
ncbi:MAG: hypothetical protein AAF580_11010 [Pseudomonadota bacterium]